MEVSMMIQTLQPEDNLHNLSLAQVAVLQSDLIARLNQAADFNDFYAKLGLPPEYFEAMYEMGVADYQAGDYESARLHLAKLLRLKPDEARFAKAMGATLQALQQYAGAINYYCLALQIKPADVSLLFYSAQCLLMLKQQNDALRVLQALLARDDAELWHEQARALLPLCTPPILKEGNEKP